MAKVIMMADSSSAKRGILFTVAVMLLSISILGFSVALSDQSAKNKVAVTYLADIDRATDAYSNLEDEIAGVVSISSNFSVKNSTAFFNETLPYSNQISADLDNLSLFYQNHSDENISITMSTGYLKAGTFLIQPNGVQLSHAAGKFYATPQNTTQSAGALSSYDLNLTFADGSISAASWANVSAPANSSVAMQVHVRVQDESRTVNVEYTYSLDKHRNSLLNITQGGATVGYVLFRSPAAVEIQYPNEMGLKASVGFSNPVYVEANDTLSVVSAANRTGRIRIA